METTSLSKVIDETNLYKDNIINLIKSLNNNLKKKIVLKVYNSDGKNLLQMKQKI